MNLRTILSSGRMAVQRFVPESEATCHRVPLRRKKDLLPPNTAHGELVEGRTQEYLPLRRTYAKWGWFDKLTMSGRVNLCHPSSNHQDQRQASVDAPVGVMAGLGLQMIDDPVLNRLRNVKSGHKQVAVIKDSSL